MTENDLLRIFPSFEKDLAAEMVAAGQIRTLQPGEVLMRTGQNIRSAMLVLEGLVKIYREDDEGNEFFMYYIDAGKACAISLVCVPGTETSTLLAKAETEATILAVPIQKVDQWMGTYKSWAQFAVSSYRERFDELLQTIDHIAFRNMDERLLFYLKRHQEKSNSNIISLSFTDMARDLNSSREVVSRLMKKLSENGVVRLHKSHIELLNLPKLLS
jgi:CRP/FNR family transcriptional regulator